MVHEAVVLSNRKPLPTYSSSGPSFPISPDQAKLAICIESLKMIRFVPFSARPLENRLRCQYSSRPTFISETRLVDINPPRDLNFEWGDDVYFWGFQND